MTRWERPSGPLNVWDTIDGFETLADGTKIPVKFSIQEVPNTEERREEVMNILIKNYLNEETCCKSLKISEDDEAIKGHRVAWNYGLDQGVAIGCYKIDPDGKIGKLVGVNVLLIANEQTFQDFSVMKDSTISNPILAKLWKLFEKLHESFDTFKLYNVDQYISSISLSVDLAFRGQKLGYHILKARSALGKKYGLSVTCTTFTGPASQKLAKLAGFEEVYELNYADFLDEEGKQVLPNAEKYSKSLKIMAKILP